MALHVKQIVEACDACADLLPRQWAQPLTQTLAHFPMHHTSADLFQLAGHHYLAFADRFSGMLWCERLTRLATEKITAQLQRWMEDSGYRQTIRTDGGPQFRGSFKAWCQAHEIRHELSSAYHPESLSLIHI